MTDEKSATNPSSHANATCQFSRQEDGLKSGEGRPKGAASIFHLWASSDESVWCTLQKGPLSFSPPPQRKERKEKALAADDVTREEKKGKVRRISVFPPGPSSFFGPAAVMHEAVFCFSAFHVCLYFRTLVPPPQTRLS